MKRYFQRLIRSLGWEIRKIDNNLVTWPIELVKEGTMHFGLKRMKELGVAPATVIDLGAAEGKWSDSTRSFWPEANYVLFEPLEERKEEMEALCRKYPQFKYVPAAAGEAKSTTRFLISDDLDGSGVYDENAGKNFRTVPVVTLDDEMDRLQLNGPYLIKFDTHGFEVPILKGAAKTLDKTELVIMECYGFKLSQTCLVLDEMIRYMADLGFRVVDIVDILRRPGDKAFWQCDVFFLRATNPIFMRTSYA